MRNLSGILFIYFLLSCLTLQQLTPVYAELNEIEFCESNSESENSDSNAQKESFSDWKVLRDRHALDEYAVLSAASSKASHMVGSDRIPASAYRSIFSPPPNNF